MPDFQQSVGLYYAAGAEGAPCSVNPRPTVVAGDSQFVSGTGGVIMGRFAWADANGLVTNAGTTVPTGFLMRTLGEAQIDSIAGLSSMTILAGREVSLQAGGDYWVKLLTAATKNQKAFASLTTGQVSAGTAGATITGSIETSWYIIQVGAIGDIVKMSKNPG